MSEENVEMTGKINIKITFFKESFSHDFLQLKLS